MLNYRLQYFSLVGWPGRFMAPLLCLCLAACSFDGADIALGTLERDRIELVADAPEPITSLPVSEGAVVEAGQVIWRQDTALQDAEVEGLRASLGRARAQLAELEHGPRSEDIAEARQRLQGARGVAEEAQLRVERFARLVSEKQASQARLDSATAQLAAARAEVGVASEQLSRLLAGTREEQIEQAAFAVAELEARLASQQVLLSRLAPVAPVAGQLDQLLYEVGERPAAGAVVAVLLGGAAPYARVHIPQAARAAIKIGSLLQVSVAGQESPLQGEVRYISADPEWSPYYALTERDRSRLMYLAEIALKSEDAAELATGLPVQVELPRGG